MKTWLLLISLALRLARAQDLTVEVSSDGLSYVINLKGEPWFKSGATVFPSGGALHSTADGSLTLSSQTSFSGADSLGAYDAISLAWQPSNPALTETFQTNFYTYSGSNALQFETVFTTGVQDTGSIGSSADDLVLTAFPSLQIAGAQGSRGYLEFIGTFIDDSSSGAHVGEWYYLAHSSLAFL